MHIQFRQSGLLLRNIKIYGISTTFYWRNVCVCAFRKFSREIIHGSGYYILQSSLKTQTHTFLEHVLQWRMCVIVLRICLLFWLHWDIIRVGNYYLFVWKAFIGNGVVISGNKLLQTEMSSVLYAHVSLL